MKGISAAALKGWGRVTVDATVNLSTAAKAR